MKCIELRGAEALWNLLNYYVYTIYASIKNNNLNQQFRCLHLRRELKFTTTKNHESVLHQSRAAFILFVSQFLETFHRDLWFSVRFK